MRFISGDLIAMMMIINCDYNNKNIVWVCGTILKSNQSHYEHNKE